MKAVYYVLPLVFVLCGVTIWGKFYKAETIVRIAEIEALQIISNYAIEGRLGKNDLLTKLDNSGDFDVTHQSDSVIILKYKKDDVKDIYGVEIETKDSLITAIRLHKP